MSTEDLVLPHDPNTGFLRGNQAAALQVSQAIAQIEVLNRNVQGLVDLIQRNAPNAASVTPNPSPQPAASPATPAEPPVARVSRPSDPANPTPPVSTMPPQRPTRDASGRVMGAPASGEDSNTAGSAARAESKDDGDSNRGFFESLLERFEQVTTGLSVPDQIDPTVGAFREITAPLRLLGSMGGSPADKKQFGLAQRTLKFLGVWRKEAKAEQDETQGAIAAAQSRQSRSSLMNGLKTAVLAPRLLAMLPVAIAATVGNAIGEKVNEALASTETGQKLLDGIGEAGAHIAATFGSEQAKRTIADNEKNNPPPPVKTSKPVGDMSWRERLLTLRAAVGSEDARQEIRENYPDNDAGRYGNSAGAQAARAADLNAAQGQSANRTANQAAATNIRGFTPERAESIRAVAQRIGIDPNDLAAIISFETAGTFSPSIKNPTSSATGLIQFMKGSGGTKDKYYGMGREQFAALPFDDQMQYVERYFKERGFDGSRKRDVADAYTAVTGYGYRKGTPAYDLNPDWDTNDNDIIEKGEAVQNPKFKAHQRQYFQQPAAEPTNQNRVENFKPIPIKAEDTIQPAPNLKLPSDAAELSKYAESLDRPAPNAPQQQSRSNQGQSPENWYDQYLLKGVGQNVEDRLIAHAITGGIGWKT